ncbi:MAG: DUF4393 domain-containing protein [Actinomycetota bacterium]|nr:DUF4393 domain-containing protein [Actinomycetota bacterium]
MASQIPGASTLLGLAQDAVNAAMATPLLGSTLTFTQEEMARVESIVWRQIRQRMDSAARPGQDTPDVPGDSALHDPVDEGLDVGPAAILGQLLATSVEQGPTQARVRLFGAVLRDLQPDEARILAALSDGTQYAVVHVAARARGLGGTGPLVLESASTVGRAANVALPECVPWYVCHLQRLGLVRIGPESARLEDTYQILLGEAVVREALESSPGAKVLRRSLRMSPLGDALWVACQQPPT